jgi:hypothetical protein
MKSINTIHRIDRHAILSDTIAFAKAKLISYSIVIDIIIQLTNETDLLIGRVMTGAFNFLTSYFPLVKYELIKLGVELFRSMLNSIGLEPKKGEPAGNEKLRLSMFRVLVIFCEKRQIYQHGTKIF